MEATHSYEHQGKKGAHYLLGNLHILGNTLCGMFFLKCKHNSLAFLVQKEKQ